MSGEQLAADVAALSALGRKLPGSPAGEAACDHICARLAALGVAHEALAFDAFLGWPVRSEVLAAGLRLEASGVAFGFDTGPEGVVGRLVDCGRGALPDRLDGAIALVDGMPRHGLLQAAAAAGAVGVITVSPGMQRHFMAASPIWGAPTSADDLALLPTIPAVQVARQDGKALRAAGPVEATLIAETRREWRTARMPVADIPGREKPFLLIGAHYDSWVQGSTDNAAGVAVLLDLARRYAKAEPRFGLRLAWWTGHEQGVYAGSSWYADHAWQELHEQAIGYLNVDIVGVAGATTKAVRNTSAELADYVTRTVARHAGSLPPAEDAYVRRALRRADRYVDPRRPARNSDQSFQGIGLSSLQVSSFPPGTSPDHLPDSGLAWWWHTEHDTPERCEPAVLTADAALHHALVEGLVNAPALPFDLAAMAQDILAGLREYEEAAPGLEGLADLDERARRLAGFASARRGLPDEVLLRVAKLLNPVMFHARSEFGYDLGRDSRLLPGLAPALEFARLDADAARMARVGLRRQVNRIRQALCEAVDLLETSAPIRPGV